MSSLDDALGIGRNVAPESRNAAPSTRGLSRREYQASSDDKSLPPIVSRGGNAYPKQESYPALIFI